MAWKTHSDLENSDPLPDSGGDTEWPCKPIVESSGWPSSWTNDSTKSKLQTPLPTPEDEAANNSQLPALLVVAEYLNSTLSLDDDDDDEFSEYIGEDGDYFVNGDEEEGFQDYDFFAKLFKEDDGLREYYEKNRENGIFCCLVCCGVREKGWKRFKDCSSLVQHSISIAKTSKRRAHRAYCQVVCEILGWDVNSLPCIVPSAGNKPIKAQGNVDDDVEDSLSGQCKSTNSVEMSLSKLSLIDGNQRGKLEVHLMDNSLSGVAVDGSLGGLSKDTSETTRENAEGTVNCVEISVTKAGVDGLLEDLSYLTLETQKGYGKGASECVVSCEETGKSSNSA